MFVIESAIYKAAHNGIDPTEIQKINLLKEGDEFHSTKTFNCNAVRCYEELDQRYLFEKIFSEIDEFNSKIN